jgi:hypothetical protein
MSTVGAYPIDPSTPTGLFRTELGDINGTPHEPDDGLADYEYVSDVAIAAWINAYPGQPDMAKSKGMWTMATQMIASAQDIQVDDIKIKTVERANLMLQAAMALGASAGAQNETTGFSVVHLDGTQGSIFWQPQGAPRAFGESGF